MVEIIQTKDETVLENNGTSRISITGDWPEILKMKPGDEITLGLANGKHGLHLVAYNRSNQPRLEDGEIEDAVLKAKSDSQ